MATIDPIDSTAAIEELPELLQDMAAAVGLQPVLALVEWRGGRYVRLPRKRPADDHILVRKLGRPAVDWLMHEAAGGGLAGETIMVPKAAGYIRAQRDAEIRARNGEGWSVARLAAHYDLHVRQIWRILAANEGADCDARQAALL